MATVQMIHYLTGEVTTVEVEDEPAPAPQPDPEALATAARAERNRLLAECDWTQVQDAPTDKAAWAAYRAAMRDVPQQAGFPVDIQWPEKPE